MTEREPLLGTPSPEVVAEAEQRYAKADAMLTKLIGEFAKDWPMMKTAVGLSDASVFYDYAMMWLTNQHHQYGMKSVEVIDKLFAAAITRLTRLERGVEDDMSQFERNMKGDNG